MLDMVIKLCNKIILKIDVKILNENEINQSRKRSWFVVNRCHLLCHVGTMNKQKSSLFMLHHHILLTLCRTYHFSVVIRLSVRTINPTCSKKSDLENLCFILSHGTTSAPKRKTWCLSCWPSIQKNDWPPIKHWNILGC